MFAGCGMVAVAYVLATGMQRETRVEEVMMTEEEIERCETATFGAGCFWCVEAVFQEIQGVKAVVSGYEGGEMPEPTYKDVCRGDTGHAEVVEVLYDPAEVTYERLLDVFWMSHDPTQLNRQGADEGTQYRSAIFVHNEAQRETAEASREALDASGVHKEPVVTEIVSAAQFYRAEDYHQNYVNNHPYAPYSIYARNKIKLLGLDKD